MLLHPVFRLQDSMQKKTLGERRWRQVAQRKKVVDEIEAYKRAHGGREPRRRRGVLGRWRG